MHITHSRAVGIAILALSTCAGAARVADDRSAARAPHVIASLGASALDAPDTDAHASDRLDDPTP